MLRCLAIATLIYTSGHPDFAAYRPTAFDRSLYEFHRDVNRIGAVTFRAATVFDPAQSLRSLSLLGAPFQTMLSNR